MEERKARGEESTVIIPSLSKPKNATSAAAAVENSGRKPEAKTPPPAEPVKEPAILITKEESGELRAELEKIEEENIVAVMTKVKEISKTGVQNIQPATVLTKNT